MTGHLRAPGDDDGVELTVHVLPGGQCLLLPGLLTTPPPSHDPCTPSPQTSPAHSRREGRGRDLHLEGVLEDGGGDVDDVPDSVGVVVVKKMFAGGAECYCCCSQLAGLAEKALLPLGGCLLRLRLGLK